MFNAGILDSSILEGLDCIQSPMSLYIDSEHCILRTEMIQVYLLMAPPLVISACR